MGDIREVKPKTPVIDFVESIPKVGPVLGGLMRALRGPWRRRHERRVQDQIDRDFHDKLRNGLPEREDVP